MTPTLIDDSQITTEIDELRSRFTKTSDLYREACVLLFFRHGITPTANKLYQYVRKGSMAAPAEALNKFWLELREKSRVRIEHPDLPVSIKESAGNFIGELWKEAQANAQSNFSAQADEANKKIAEAQAEMGVERDKRQKCEAEIKTLRDELETAQVRLAESGKKRAVDISALDNLRKSLKTLQNDREQLEHGLEAARQAFSTDLDKVNVSLAKAEERYRALEARSLLEVDRERQRSTKLEKELSQLRDVQRKQQQLHNKEIAASHKIHSSLREKLGLLNGQLAVSKRQQNETAKKLNSAQQALVTCKIRLQAKKN